MNDKMGDLMIEKIQDALRDYLKNPNEKNWIRYTTTLELAKSMFGWRCI